MPLSYRAYFEQSSMMAILASCSTASGATSIGNIHALSFPLCSYPDDMAGEIPLAFIVRWPGTNLTEKDVMSYVADQV